MENKEKQLLATVQGVPQRSVHYGFEASHW